MPLESDAVVPSREAWLYENDDALESVLRGLRESAAGEVHDLGSFAEPDGEDAQGTGACSGGLAR